MKVKEQNSITILTGKRSIIHRMPRVIKHPTHTYKGNVFSDVQRCFQRDSVFAVLTAC